MLRLSELYTSLQGEGPNTGLPTQFVRFAGCNLRCPGWPCDTQHAIDPAIWRHESESIGPRELLDRLAEWPRAITLTGGEPYIQPEGQYQEFVQLARELGYTVEVFTNGTQHIPTWAVFECSHILDWKLPGSGETLKADLFQARANNIKKLGRRDSVKFVCKDLDDMDEAKKVTYQLLMDGHPCQLWAGIVWGGELTNEQLAEYIVQEQMPWRLNVQVHKFIWKAEARRV
jgi:7-carboxy-7-deazaguanine synthase